MEVGSWVGVAVGAGVGVSVALVVGVLDAADESVDVVVGTLVRVAGGVVVDL